MALSKTFYMLIQTQEFRSLPDGFLYHSKILELQKKIQSFTESIDKHESIRLKLSVEQRAAIFTMLVEMDGRVKDVKINEASGQA